SALEYIRGWICRKKGEDPLLYEPVDKVLEKLSNDQRFKECLINMCEMNNVNMEAVKKRIGGTFGAISIQVSITLMLSSSCETARDWLHRASSL
ncbi:24706_t:CDS:2, partial [Dentiscutata erythropus]